MSFKIKVDDELCMGAQRCMFLAPEAFDLTEEGIAEVTDAGTLTLEQAEKVAYECPNMAIIVEKD
ncbi:hypothetical protein GCM10023321_05790 [Pseudonocardia eucalypti]|uniref:Ferredoxin n=1 Tax=Pseudonocardia eucalypti TaxID=648755 RepID=A0ABP9PGW7_9PSEU|nr:ferredoxin [Pseudonocardia eucalypti]